MAPRALILLATENEQIGFSLPALLRADGHDVVVAWSLIDAIAELHGAEFDLAVVDIDLSPRGGVDLVRVAKQLSAETEVVMLVGAVDADRAIECVRAGVFDFVRQPVSQGELRGVVQRSVEHRAARSQTTMTRASQAILAGTDTQRLAGVIVDQARDLLACDFVTLFRGHGTEASPAQFYVAEHSGATDDELSRELGIIVATLAPTLLDLRPVMLPDEIAPGALSLEPFPRIRSVLFCPIILGGQVGAIFAAVRSADPRPFRRGDAERATVVASQIRLALDNAALIQKALVDERLVAIGALAASVAHELNNPVAYALANSQLAIDELEALASSDPRLDEVRQMLADVKEGAERIRDIARDLQSLGRSEKGALTFDLNDAVRSALRIVGGRLRGAVSVVVDLGDGVLASGSPGRMSQVFVNLFVNAAQAAAASSRPVELRVQTRLADGKIVARVADTGPGVAPSHLARIFEPFFTTKPSESGTGLGLAVTRAIVQEHAGTIEVESTAGSGTTFLIELPAPPKSIAPSRPHAGPGRPSPRRRFLFVDDDWAVLRTYERWFGRDHDVVTVQAGSVALDLLAQDTNFDRIVCDVSMPEVSGKDVYRREAERDARTAERFVFVTGGMADPEIRDFVVATGRPVVEKPFALQSLRSVLGTDRQAGARG